MDRLRREGELGLQHGRMSLALIYLHHRRLVSRRHQRVMGSPQGQALRVWSISNLNIVSKAEAIPGWNAYFVLLSLAQEVYLQMLPPQKVSI